MSNTTAEYWSWTPGRSQGLGTEISLAQEWLNITTLGGSRSGVPVNRGNDYEVPYRAGSAWRAKWPQSRTITLVMWTTALTSSGTVPSDLFGQWNANWQKIRQSFYNRGARGSLQGKLTRRWSIGYQGAPASIVQASAMAEIGSDMAPSMTGRARADFSVDLVLADPYFYGATNRTATLAYGVPQNVVANGEGVVGEGWPSAVNDFTVVLNGPLTTPKITNATEGLAVQYNGTIAGGKSVTLDILRSSAVTSDGADAVGAVSHYGARMWMALTGGENPFNTLTLTSTSGSDTGTAAINWNDTYI